MLGLALFAEYVPGICRWDNLYIWKTQRPVLVRTAIETVPLLLIGSEYLLQFRAANLASRFHCAIELFRCCIEEIWASRCVAIHISSLPSRSTPCSAAPEAWLSSPRNDELGSLSSGLADECCDRNVLERSLL